ncbi:hypothetical protein GH714_040553 [Hevea brasiliensis]|uniref:Uncharacterized protein n=1 Tax=Hevea brasiliensis TaxID=3981 RepID=A0A6A6L6C0_HEVBR|nr:hypothetical protein GH714_040553 [Hevea brasiliensis]
MGSKKRSSGCVEVENFVDTNTENVASNPIKKKLKKGKEKVVETAHGGAFAGSGTSAVPSSIKPMEKRKERKVLVKERRRLALENEESKPGLMQVDKKVNEITGQMVGSSTGGLPEFHIGVFKDLTSADVSVREAAVERLCARQGFALGLTVLVSTIPSIKLHSLLKLIVDLLEVSSSMKGQEIKDCLLGHLFAYGALAQSGRINQEWMSDQKTPFIKEFVNALLSLASKKRYLQEPAIAIILDLVDKLPTDVLLNHILETPGLCYLHLLFQLFYPKLVQCLMDILSTKDSWLYKVAEHFLKELSDWVGNDDVRRVAVIVALQKHSNGKFDNITRTKMVKTLMAEFETEAGSMLFIQNLMNMFVDEDHTSEEPSDQSQTADDNSEIVTSFDLQEKFRWPKVASSNATCKMCIQQIQFLLASAQKIEVHILCRLALSPMILGLTSCSSSTLHNIPSVSLFWPLSNEDEKAFEKLQEMETRLSREERNCGLSTDANRLHALKYLLIQLLLQVLLRPGELSEAVSELIICCKKAFAVSDLLDSSGENELDSDDTPEVVDVLVDTLLSLLPQSPAPMRSAIEQVFKCFCDNVTNDGLLQMLRVIKKDLKPARHQEPDSEDDDEDFLCKPQVLTVYSDLTSALVKSRTTEINEQLGQRIWGILQKKIFKSKDFPKGEATQLSTLESLLEKSLKLASKPFKRKKSAVPLKKQSTSWNRDKMIVSLAQNSTHWILKIIDARNFSESELQGVVDIFKGVLTGFFDSKRSRIKSEFLKEIFRRRPWIGHHLFSFLLEKCGSAKSVFRRVDALDLVMEILKSMVSSGTDESSRNASKKILKNHLHKLSYLVKNW